MKKFYLPIILCILGWTTAYAQIPDGSIAPDFTGTDLDGNSHNLYDLLEAGKTVYLDVSATWCGPCWNYHNSHALRNLWNEHGPDGTDEAFVFFIEGDGGTNTACLYGPSGCIGGTQGDWVSGTPYPIIDDASIANAYQITYFPTIFCICPADKKVYETGQMSASGLWAFRETYCAPPPVAYSLNSTRNVKCFNTSTGAIDITPSGGVGNFTYVWSNGATTQDLNNVLAGVYTVSITSGGVTLVSDPIDVFQPDQALSGEVLEYQLVGCNGILGSITTSGVGGWDSEYSYAWQNGQNTETATGLSAGTYRVTITDAEGCTATLSHTLAPPVYPVANVAAAPLINCTHPIVQLNATASDSGDDISYQWFASGGGHIVSGGSTTTPMVNAAGNYTIQVTNTTTSCVSYDAESVDADQALPSSNAGDAGVVSCPVPLDTLQGSASSGSNFSYNWTGVNVVSGGNTLAPVVGAPGVYTLAVTNTANGCTRTSTTSVTGFNTPPTVSTNGGILTCGILNVVLNTSTNSGNPTFSWTGPNGYSSHLQNPTVSSSGSYNVVVNDTITGCANNATATVTANTAAPGATATATAMTCVVNSATVLGATPDTNATYAWTGPNGFSSNLASFSVSVEGPYNLVVTDTLNGCTSTAVATVVSNTTPPVASALTPGNLNCNTTQIQLNGTGSSQGNNMSYTWSTTNGHLVSGENTLTPVVDAIGDYQLLVHNGDNGCSATTSTTVQQSAAVTANIPQQTNVLCFGGASGSATASGSGGNGVFSYAWSNGGNTASISNVAAGVYVVSIADAENCSATATVSIIQPDILAANASATGQTMNGVNDGTASANPSGGTATYQYTWSNGEQSQTIVGLAPGIYSVTVVDLNACISVQTVTVNAFNCALSANVSGNNVTCNGASNGSASVTYIGGVEPLNFQWSNGASTPSVSNLAGGVYTVNVTDANNCPAALNVTILEPAPLASNASATNETAAGANDGSATANPTGGNGAYTYLWSNGATSQSLSGLAPGEYTVAVTDQNGCVNSQTVTVSSFACAIQTSTTITHVRCAGAANGAVSVVLNGGEAPFTYDWSNGGNSSTISNLNAGAYTATITDANHCQVVYTTTVNEPLPFGAWDVQTTNPACANDATGAAIAVASGATAPYSYLWNNGATGNQISNVAAGNYTVQATDANGCTSNAVIAIVSTDQEAPTVSAQNVTKALDNAGNVVVTLADINAQFADNCGISSTVISPNAFSCSQLGTQVVTLTVTDFAGLTNSTTVTVNIVDTQAPVLTCPANMVVCGHDNFVQYQPATAQDNCLSLNGEWQQTSGLPSPSEFPEGTTVQTFTFSDASGNLGTCSFSVTVSTQVTFDNTEVKNDQNGLGIGAINISPLGGTAPYTFEWTNNGNVIATTEDVVGLAAGTYAVEVTDAQGCVYTLSDIVVANFVSAKEPLWLNGVSLQPNPTSDLTNIVFANPFDSRLEITVIDATGRVLKTQISEQAKVITIDCTELPGGMYTLRFRSNNELGARKLMVVK